MGELLKLETLLDTTGALKGEALNWNGNRWERQKTALWRNESALRRYIPHYRFTNWRDVKRNYPIEVFETGVIRALGQGGWQAGQEPAVQEPAEQHSATLFDRTLRRTAWFCVPWDEFLAEDGR